MVTEIKTEKLGKEETKKILAGGIFPCQCGDVTIDNCGTYAYSSYIFNQNRYKN
ncbi:MAG: hypothetical protein ACM3SY_11665 [Candidatus Omnitrophota bacterium]